MKYTGNYNLKKPDGTDVVNIEDLNENADIIDAELKRLNDAIKDLDADSITLPDGKTISEKFEEITEEVGNIQELNTDEKANIVAAINEINQVLVAHKADYMQHTPYAIATGTNSYAVSIPGISSLVEGMSVKVKFTSANTGTCTLNINGLGAKEIRKSNGNSLSAGNIKAGQICHLVYTGSVFQLLGEGGEYGNVTPEDVIKGVTFGTEEGLKTGTLELTGDAATADVLSGKTFYSTNPKSKLTGTMSNRGAVTHTITTQGGSYTIPAGYHNGSGKVTAQFANLIASNIRDGVTIGGVTGTLKTLNLSSSRVLMDNYELELEPRERLGKSFSGSSYSLIIALVMKSSNYTMMVRFNNKSLLVKGPNLVNGITIDSLTNTLIMLENTQQSTRSVFITIIGVN